MVKGLHTKENCHYYSSHKMVCPYCNSGSKPVDKSVIIEGVKNGVK
jgi:DNA-binding helix-hairpin-helix protein with protein kinase domain